MEIQSIVVLILIILAIFFYTKKRQSRQLAYIQSYVFHPALGNKVKEKYPYLNNDQINTVFEGLRDYFTFCNQSKRRMVAMPSQVVDVAWHEFILFTRAYEAFSKKALGKFLHHTPTVAMKSSTLAQEGIKRAWRLACAQENINPSAPTRLPRIFAIDSLLNIEDGFKYSLNCKDKSSPNYGDGYCAGHIGCASGCAGDSGRTSDSGSFFDSIGGGSDCGGGGGCGGD
jgi:hypothetical protein